MPTGASATDPQSPRTHEQREVDAVMAAARVLVGVVARSVAEVESQVSVPQLRVLVLIATRGALNLSSLAEAIGVHPSNATRTVERLVSAGFVDRRDAPDDRRNVRLTLTKKGSRLVASVFEHRRAAIEEVVGRMPQDKRRALPAALESFAEAAGEPAEDHFGDMRWTS
ncbi:MarR family winged helix-turn-helix transcriptional regulator [Cumulibacter manganitolerans]|uniref:MarR family winged helix-turn-helix transcriptional regulator n=1 Tax=Cumulibacter manganitolerans TaxID=1884992 RepID=UPI001E5F3872|nr:MarR family transcriptional regulator [Cumulibacter manganitolerans]